MDKHIRCVINRNKGAIFWRERRVIGYVWRYTDVDSVVKQVKTIWTIVAVARRVKTMDVIVGWSDRKSRQIAENKIGC